MRPNTWQRILAILFISQLTTAVGFSSIFPFLPLYVKSLGSSLGLSVELLAGLVFSAQAFTMMLASPVWGSLADRYGRKLMVVRASFGGSLLILLMAFVRSGEELVALRALQGLVTGTVAANSALLAAQAPRDRLGYAMGMLQVGLGAGVAIGPIIGGAIADAFGYRAAFYITAALLFISGVMVLFGVREQFDETRAVESRTTSFFSLWRLVIATPGVAMSYTLRFLSQLGRMMFVPVAPFFVEELMSGGGGVNSFTGLVIGLGAGATTLTAGFFGRLGDRIGFRTLVAISAIAAGLFYLPQSIVQEPWQLLALSILVGIAMGGVLPLISALLASYSRAGGEGSVYGIDNAIRASARAIAPLIVTAVLVRFGIRATFLLTGAIFIFTGLLARVGLPAPPQQVETPLEASTLGQGG
ncbi:MAG: MFS transporter [Anaerolineales bacterium]|nr:MFS transporter [Anaerolineales bacterium]